MRREKLIFLTMDDFKPIIYKSIAEKREAFLRAVNMRKIWEEEMRQKIAEMDARKQLIVS